MTIAPVAIFLSNVVRIKRLDDEEAQAVRISRLLTAKLVAAGGAAIAMATAPGPWAAPVILAGAWIVFYPSNTAINSHVDRTVPDEVSGRVGSLRNMTTMAAAGLSSVGAASAIGAWGPEPTAIGMAAVFGSIAFVSVIRRIFGEDKALQDPAVAARARKLLDGINQTAEVVWALGLNETKPKPWQKKWTHLRDAIATQLVKTHLDLDADNPFGHIIDRVETEGDIDTAVVFFIDGDCIRRYVITDTGTYGQSIVFDTTITNPDPAGNPRVGVGRESLQLDISNIEGAEAFVWYCTRGTDGSLTSLHPRQSNQPIPRKKRTPRNPLTNTNYDRNTGKPWRKWPFPRRQQAGAPNSGQPHAEATTSEPHDTTSAPVREVGHPYSANTKRRVAQPDSGMPRPAFARQRIEVHVTEEGAATSPVGESAPDSAEQTLLLADVEADTRSRQDPGSPSAARTSDSRRPTAPGLGAMPVDPTFLPDAIDAGRGAVDIDLAVDPTGRLRRKDERHWVLHRYGGADMGHGEPNMPAPQGDAEVDVRFCKPEGPTHPIRDDHSSSENPDGHRIPEDNASETKAEAAQQHVVEPDAGQVNATFPDAQPKTGAQATSAAAQDHATPWTERRSAGTNSGPTAPATRQRAPSPWRKATATGTTSVGAHDATSKAVAEGVARQNARHPDGELWTALGAESMVDILNETDVFLKDEHLHPAVIVGHPYPARMLGGGELRRYLMARIASREYGDQPLTVDFIQDLHRKVAANTRFAGDFTLCVVAGLSSPLTESQLSAVAANPLLEYSKPTFEDKFGLINYPYGISTQIVMERLELICDQFNEAARDPAVDNVELAAWLHWKLVSNHPFHDRNGIVCRILLNRVLENRGARNGKLGMPSALSDHLGLVMGFQEWVREVRAGVARYSERKSRYAENGDSISALEFFGLEQKRERFLRLGGTPFNFTSEEKWYSRYYRTLHKRLTQPEQRRTTGKMGSPHAATKYGSGGSGLSPVSVSRVHLEPDEVNGKRVRRLLPFGEVVQRMMQPLELDGELVQLPLEGDSHGWWRVAPPPARSSGVHKQLANHFWDWHTESLKALVQLIAAELPVPPAVPEFRRDLSRLLAIARAAHGGARLVYGIGHGSSLPESRRRPGDVLVHNDGLFLPDVQADVRDLRIIPDEIFDEVLYSIYVDINPFTEQYSRAAFEIYRVLKPGGRFLIQTWGVRLDDVTLRRPIGGNLDDAGFIHVEFDAPHCEIRAAKPTVEHPPKLLTTNAPAEPRSGGAETTEPA